MRHLPIDLRLLLTLATLVSLVATPAEGKPQCFVSDNLQGPCCTNTAINLPAPLPYPLSPLPASGICWTACQPSDTPTELRFGGFTEITCGAYTGPLIVQDLLSGFFLMRGELRLDYTRTWSETNFDTQNLQCWRFLAKVDLFPIVPGMPCPVPQGGEPHCFYYGYFDIAKNCTTGGFEFALCLFHSCDEFIHNPLTSSVPGVFHPLESYALVAPVSPANPFVPTPLTPFSGLARAGGMRNASAAMSDCWTEERILPWHARAFLKRKYCACPDDPTHPLQYSQLLLGGWSSCKSTFLSLVPSNVLPWKHLVTVSLGTWVGAGIGTPYPGPEAAWVNEGAFKSNTNCSLFTIALGEAMYGAMTDDGFPVIADVDRPYQTDRMLDLATNYSKFLSVLGGPYNGSVQPTTRLIHLNF